MITLHVEPPHLDSEGAALSFEKSVLALPVERVGVLEDVEAEQAAVQVEQTFGQRLHHFLHQSGRLVQTQTAQKSNYTNSK